MGKNGKRDGTIQKGLQISVENARYLAKIKFEKGINYTDLINMILDEYRKNNLIK